MTPLQITLVILLVTIIAFASGKIPIAVISSGIMIALILTGVRTPKKHSADLLTQMLLCLLRCL
nr:hypothetical protein [uncultured Blautia sp.]